MGQTIDVTIPLEPDAARLLEHPARRAALGRYLSALLTGDRAPELLAEAIAAAKREARGNNLTDEMIEAELNAWRDERAA